MIYIYKASIPESKIFMRVYEVRSDMTFFEFNSFINNDLGFSPDQMIIFEGYKNGTLTGEYGLFDMGDGAIDSVTFKMLHQKGEDEIHYVFNIRSDRYIKLDYIGEAPASGRISYPRTTDEKGRNPDQFSKYEDLDDFGLIGDPIGDPEPDADAVMEGLEETSIDE